MSDRSARWINGTPDMIDYSTIQVPTLRGYFRIKWDGSFPFKSPTFYMNEARNGTLANIKWSWSRLEGNGSTEKEPAYVLLLVVIRFIQAGEELFVVYN